VGAARKLRISATTFGLPFGLPDWPARPDAFRCARALIGGTKRAGVHTLVFRGSPCLVRGGFNLNRRPLVRDRRDVYRAVGGLQCLQGVCRSVPPILAAAVREAPSRTAAIASSRRACAASFTRREFETLERANKPLKIQLL
jgi:hypothetical protein